MRPPRRHRGENKTHDSKNDLARVRWYASASLSLSALSATATRSKTLSIKLLSAPYAETEPTSSLSKRAIIETRPSDGSDDLDERMRASVAAKEEKRLSRRAEKMNSF